MFSVHGRRLPLPRAVASMPARSNAFQKLVFLLQSQLACGESVVESVGLRDKVTGGVRETDIRIEGELAGHPVGVSVECVDWKRRATVDWVDRMLGKHATLPTDKLVLVSRSGFTRQARDKAATAGCVALALEEAESADWTKIVGRFDCVYMDTVAVRHEASVVVADANGARSAHPVARSRQLLLQRAVVEETTVGAIADEMMSLPEVARGLLGYMSKHDLHEEDLTLVYTFPEAVTAIDKFGGEQAVLALQLAVHAARTKTRSVIRSGRLQDVPVAYAQFKDTLGEVDVAVVERKGHPAVINVAERSSGIPCQAPTTPLLDRAADSVEEDAQPKDGHQ